jgi:hypothetical protein
VSLQPSAGVRLAPLVIVAALTRDVLARCAVCVQTTCHPKDRKPGGRQSPRLRRPAAG